VVSAGIEQTLEHRTRAASVAAVREALEAAGVTFLRDDARGAGVRAFCAYVWIPRLEALWKQESAKIAHS
jgi:hypothetical protein